PRPSHAAAAAADAGKASQQGGAAAPGAHGRGRCEDGGLLPVPVAIPGLGGSEGFVAVGGTIGYIAPEYGMGYKISTGCDVYSFGVLLLEMLTGKRPTDAMFIDGMSLHKLVSSAYPNGLHEVLDPYMSQEGDRAFASSTLKGYLVPLVEIALLCSMELPKDRPVMQDICARIFEI
ncbi:unnamed protein product, partial [Urochloa humidicola]